MKTLLYFCLFVIAAVSLHAETLPDKPANYFNDYAGVVDDATVIRLNEKLADFEKTTTNQVIVAIYPSVDSERDVDDLANTLFKKWQLGNKEKNNAILYLIIVKGVSGHHEGRIEVGYGLEGALPDITARKILDNDAIPLFKANNWTQGFDTSINEIFDKTKDEFKGAAQATAATKAKITAKSLGEGVAIFLVCFLLCGLVFGWDVAFQIFFNIILRVIVCMLSGGSSSSSSSRGSGGDSGGGGASSEF